MLKNKINQTSKPQLFTAIEKAISDTRKAAVDEKRNEILKIIEGESIQKKEPPKKCLESLFKDVYKLVKLEHKEKLKSIWKNKDLTLQLKVDLLAEIIIDATTTFGNLKRNVLEAFKILKIEEELKLFLEEPQTYINKHKNLSVYDLHILQSIINHSQFNCLPFVNRQVYNTYIHTPLSTHMSQLDLLNYASMDAVVFPGCINPEVKEEVLEKSKKEYLGPQVMGLAGALLNYDRKAIQKTASFVKKMKLGACHSFAQLAADHLLTSIEKGQLSPMPIKLVSHQNKLRSHTFLLIYHVSSDLTDLSNCLILDPWAVVMGYRSTYGLYTKEDYPYPLMLSNLVCCYNSQVPVISDKESKATNSSLNQELQSVVTRRGFFSRNSGVLIRKNLNDSQRQAVQFITELSAISSHTIKKDLMRDLVNSIESQEVRPEKATRLAAFVSQVRVIEKNNNNYKWKKLTAIDDSTLPAFNGNSIFPFWKAFIKCHDIAPIVPNFKTIDINILHKIINFLRENEDLEFNKSMIARNRI